MGRGRPRKIDPETALDIAIEMFWKKGFEGTSMNDLAAATGMAKPGLYATFGDKQALYAKALTRYFREHGAGLLDDLVHSDDPLRVVILRFLTTVAASSIDKNCPGGCFVVNSVNDCINHPGTLEELAHSIDVERRGAFIKRFQMAQKKGELRDEVDPKILGEFFAGQVLAISVMGRAGASRKNLDQFIETAMTVIG